MKIIDTHCHYNLEPLYSGQADRWALSAEDPLLKMNWQAHWQKAQASGVVGSVVVGTGLETSQLALEIADQQPNLLASVGIHPLHAQAVTLEALTEAGKTWLAKHPSAVGETGLDFYRLDRQSHDFEDLAVHQRTIFNWHLQFAKDNHLPLILHVRDKTDQAYRETLGLLKKIGLGSRPFVLHCASGPNDYIQEAVAMGGYFGFDGNLTYPQAGNVRELIKSVPADRLMIETDAPFLAPEGYRGRLCEPWQISLTAKYAQQELGIEPAQLLANSQQFFGHSFG